MQNENKEKKYSELIKTKIRLNYKGTTVTATVQKNIYQRYIITSSIMHMKRLSTMIDRVKLKS